ncbi:triacylglycerol lipase [Dietzia natronolimnaea]|uniref:Triacylglycerol lipase n=1 Tax=Dietzia natronolimnaea TaxID=161920 RepID=A0A2A2WSU4_9ACTN|nr:alpha/beta fold hydrolase [Dietzia natronolimnaea]PAY24225.1 triacylglycerol lipase [Dietzia natronolimnaea]
MIGAATRPPARPLGARRIVAAVAVVAVAVLLVGSATTPARAQSPTEGPLPVPFDISAGFQASLAPEIPPPGANDPNCRPTSERPRPVVLVHPTFTTQALAWQAGAPVLNNAGYCVHTFTFGNVTGFPAMPIQGLGDIRASGLVLQEVVDRALAETGADAVDLVGHSQGGGILADYYLTVLGPAVYGSLEHSTPALIQQVVDSPLAAEVYPRGPEGIPGVRMYSIVSQFDQIVTPFVRQFYSGDVTNIELQAGCAEDLSEHVATLYSERVWLHVLNALAPAEARPVPCFHVAPYAPWVR